MKKNDLLASAKLTSKGQITIPKSVTTFETTDSQGRVYTFNSNYFSNLQTIYIKNPEGTYDTSKWQSVTASIQYT